MASSQRICIIVNPAAGHYRSKKLLPEVTGLLSQRGIEFDLFETEGPGHAEALAQELCHGDYRMLVAMGGDGTLGEVINGLFASPCANTVLGAIPAGTGNDFIGGNHLSLNLEEIVEAIAAPSVKKIDVLKVTDGAGRVRYGINSVGVGFDAYVVKRVSELKSKRLGSISYAIEVIRGLFSFKPTRMQIDIDGASKSVNHAWLCAFTNGERFGGGMKITPGAAFDDGFVNIAYLSEVKRLRLVALLLKVFKGKHVGMAGVHIEQGKKIIIQPRTDYPCHLDGDVRNMDFPVCVEVIPAALPFLIRA